MVENRGKSLQGRRNSLCEASSVKEVGLCEGDEWVVAGLCSVACYKMLSHASAQRRAAIAGSRPSSSCLNPPYLFPPLQKEII